MENGKHQRSLRQKYSIHTHTPHKHKPQVISLSVSSFYSPGGDLGCLVVDGLAKVQFEVVLPNHEIAVPTAPTELSVPKFEYQTLFLFISCVFLLLLLLLLLVLLCFS